MANAADRSAAAAAGHGHLHHARDLRILLEHLREHLRVLCRELLDLAEDLLEILTVVLRALSAFSALRFLRAAAALALAAVACLKELIEAGKVRPVIDRTYPLSNAAEAVRYLETGHARAKVVITV